MVLVTSLDLMIPLCLNRLNENVESWRKQVELAHIPLSATIENSNDFNYSTQSE